MIEFCFFIDLLDITLQLLSVFFSSVLYRGHQWMFLKAAFWNSRYICRFASLMSKSEVRKKTKKGLVCYSSYTTVYCTVKQHQLC